MDLLPSRDSRASAAERTFTKDAIRAIEELELRRVSRTTQQLADAAWEKLQYDLPVVEATELAALVEMLRCSLKGKTSWPCYVLTHKALENIVGSSKRSTSFAPELLEHRQQPQQHLADAISAPINSPTGNSSRCQGYKAAAAADTNGSTASTTQQQSGQCLQDLYQQLCAVVLLQYVAKVVSLSEQDAWQLLYEYQPEQEHDKPQQQQQQLQHTESQAWQRQLQGQQEQLFLQQLAAGSLQDAPAGVGVNHSNTAGDIIAPSVAIYEASEAAVQDEDGDEYEPYEPLDTAQHATHNARNGSSHQQQQQQAYSWLELRHRMLSLAHQVQYNLLCCESLWQQQAAAEHVLQVLRALGAHSHAAELQPMVHAYAGLLVDRVAAAPTHMHLLQQMWEALGLTAQGGGAGNVAAVIGQQGQLLNRHYTTGQGLPAEAVLGLTAAATVWQQVSGSSSSRSRLWRLMYDNLFPLLEQCTEQLAYHSSSGSNQNRIRKCAGDSQDANRLGAAQQQQEQQAAGERLGHVLLVSHVMELLVIGRPVSVDAAGQLTQLGATRNLVQLFVQHSSDVAAEPLRRALLFCCCSSQRTADWVLAVPAVTQQLQQPVFQLAGPAEAHGALWQMIIRRSRPAVPAASSSTSCQLLSLLHMLTDSAQQLQRQVVLLQLMCDAQQAAGRQRLWDDTVLAAVKQLAALVKDSQAAAAAAATAEEGHLKPDQVQGWDAVPAAGDGDSSAPCNHSNVSSALEDYSKGLNKTGSGGLSTGGHEQRRLQQLRSVLLKSAKQLLTQGGKTD